MTSFVDGPAKGTVLQLQRAPFLLRVVSGKPGEFDALDQPDDEPKLYESIYVYRLAGPPGSVHICRSPRRSSGWFAVAEYKLLDRPVRDADVRTTADWNDWCDRNMNDLVAGTWAEGKLHA